MEEYKNVIMQDITPTWLQLLPLFIAVLEDGDQEGKISVKSELKRMAQAADKYNEILKEE